jgi:predicted deacylase
VRVGGAELSPGRHELSLAVPGTPEIAVQVVVGRHPGPTAFVLAGHAGDDPLGRALVAAVAAAVSPDTLQGTLLCLGRAGGSMDRHFADDLHVATAVLRLVVAGAAAGIEIRPGHGDEIPTALHVAADPRDPIAQKLADAFDLPVVLLARAPKGSLPHAARHEKVPVVTLHPTSDLASARDGILRCLARAGLRKERPRVGVGARSASVTRLSSRAAGWLAPLVAPGAVVGAGEPLALLCDDDGALLTTVAAPAQAFVLGLAAAGRHDPGAVVARLVKLPSSRRRPLRALHVGWCEDVALPDLGIPRLLAKIDTGARTSALHVTSAEWISDHELDVRLPGRSQHTRVRVVENVVVRDSGGHDERRPVIETRLTLGPLTRRVRLTLTNRGEMEFPMLVGRSALGPEIVVHPASRHLTRR